MQIDENNLSKLIERIEYYDRSKTVEAPALAHLKEKDVLWYSLDTKHSMWIYPVEEIEKRLGKIKNRLKEIEESLSDEFKVVDYEKVSELQKEKDELLKEYNDIYTRHIDTVTIKDLTTLPLGNAKPFMPSSGSGAVYFQIIDNKLKMYFCENSFKEEMIERTKINTDLRSLL